MDLKLRKSIAAIIGLFLGGSLIIFTGFSRGQAMASSLSRPIGATGWVIPEEMVKACTYTPVIIGTSFIILSIVFSTVLFINYINKP